MAINHSTRWIDSQSLTEIAIQLVSEAFVNPWITRSAVSLQIVRKRGSRFESELVWELSNIVGSHGLRTNDYHPKFNCLIKKTQRTSQTWIKAGKKIGALNIIIFTLQYTQFTQ